MIQPPKPFPPCRIEATDLGCLRGFNSLFEGLSLTISSGNTIHVTGANGSGKTSLLRILCGLSLAETGQINWNGNNIGSVSSEYRANLSYLGHKPALKPDLTAHENLVSTAATGNRALRDARSTATEYLTLLRVEHTRDRLCRQLSAGQRQRIAVARVVMSDAPIWILDEPGTSLDSEGIELLSSLMRSHIERNGLIIFTSHQGFNLPVDRLDRICLDSA